LMNTLSHCVGLLIGEEEPTCLRIEVT
jgi:hypothetical protein